MMNSRQAYFSTALLWLTLVLVSFGNQTRAASIDSFFKQNCDDCHNAEVNEANLNLANLKLDLENRDNFAIWNRVLERVSKREMPPKEEPQPSNADVKNFVAVLEKPLLAADQAEIVKNGRVRSRRLTRVEGKSNYRGPEFRDEESISWPIGTQFYGRMTSIEIPDDGWYRVTLRKVRAINPGSTGASDDGAVWGTLQSGTCSSNAPMLYLVGLVEATATQRDLVYQAWIQKGNILELKPNDGELKRAKTGFNGGTVSYENRDLEKDGYSGIAHQGIEIQRIYPVADHTGVRKNLFEDSDQESIQANPSQSLDFLVTRFANRAFRRPMAPAQLAPYLEIGRQALSDGETIADALRSSYRAILCSPRFLTFIEAPGELDAYAVASRLSYSL